MKKLILLAILAIASLSASAGTGDAVFNKAIATYKAAKGIAVKYSMTGAVGNSSGEIIMQGNKFCITASNMICWYNGKTQWSYLKSTNEVNITTPTEAKRMKMNPYTFITMYKSGYNMGVKTSGSNYVVHLTAQNKQRSVQELYVTVNKTTYTPVQVRMKEGNTWTTINISNFKAAKLPDSTFTFNAKDYPTAEVIDLR